MRVNIVVKPGWILERCAREVERAVPDSVVNATPWPPTTAAQADLTYYLPMKDIRHSPEGLGGLSVGFFTHGEERVRTFAPLFDHAVAMNEQVADLLRKLAVPVTVIRPGVEAQRHITFGVCGTLHKGRKGPDMVRAAVAAGFDFMACTDDAARSPCRVWTSIENRSKFYGAIDYLVVTSTEEGGPMPVVEALAAGVPVIAPNVGWCWEFPVIRYEKGSWISLLSVLTRLTRIPTWEEWGAAHRRLFKELLG